MDCCGRVVCVLHGCRRVVLVIRPCGEGDSPRVRHLCSHPHRVWCVDLNFGSSCLVVASSGFCSVDRCGSGFPGSDVGVVRSVAEVRSSGRGSRKCVGCCPCVGYPGRKSVGFVRCRFQSLCCLFSCRPGFRSCSLRFCPFAACCRGCLLVVWCAFSVDGFSVVLCRACA
jgi:hypothetical protein